MRDYTIINVLQTTHYQGDVRHGTYRGIQRSCMSLVLVRWVLFKSPGLWNTLDLDCILSKGDRLFKFMGKFKHIGI